MLRLVATLVLANFLLKVAVAAGESGDASHPCERPCDGKTMECEYDWDIKTYSTMAISCFECPFNPEDCKLKGCIPGNGFRRILLVINEQFPGPQIRVCHGDTIKVNVANHMTNYEGFSIHWHGMYQKMTCFQDGVAGLTQCPIMEGQTWKYEFIADPPGTHWWHAHTGPQRGDGAFGTLIVRERKDPHADLYDFDLKEHVLTIQDYEREASVSKLTTVVENDANNHPDFMLINGRGTGYEVEYPARMVENIQGDRNHEDRLCRAVIPYPVYHLTPNKRHRFRLVSTAILNCPLEVFIQSHQFSVIATDGVPIQPVTGNILHIGGGERFDIVLEANQRVGNYWFYARGLLHCEDVEQIVIFRYDGAPDAEPTGDKSADRVRENGAEAIIVNPLNDGMFVPSPTDSLITLGEMRGLYPAPDWIDDTPDKRYYLGIDLKWVYFDLAKDGEVMDIETNRRGTGAHIIAHVNHVGGTLSDVPYLSQPADIPQDQFLEYDPNNHNYVPSECETDIQKDNQCNYFHTLRADLGDVVEMVMIDVGVPFNGTNHPMHIHGQHWRIVGVGQSPARQKLKQEVMDEDAAGKIKRNFDHPISKDTVMVPDGGYIIGKFKAENPGIWYFHCHNDLHTHAGLTMVIVVGNPNQWLVPDNVPKCGSYLTAPDVKKLDNGLNNAVVTKQINRRLQQALDAAPTDSSKLPPPWGTYVPDHLEKANHLLNG